MTDRPVYGDSMQQSSLVLPDSCTFHLYRESGISPLRNVYFLVGGFSVKVQNYWICPESLRICHSQSLTCGRDVCHAPKPAGNIYKFKMYKDSDVFSQLSKLGLIINNTPLRSFRICRNCCTVITKLLRDTETTFLPPSLGPPLVQQEGRRQQLSALHPYRSP